MQPERAELYFQQGSSDKVYHLHLEGAQDQWAVQRSGGGAVQSDLKVSGTSYEEAKRVYDRILREKTGKGYQFAQASANGNEAIAVGLPATKEHSGHTPELLTPIEEPEALLLAQDASWWFQQKFDGRTCASHPFPSSSAVQHRYLHARCEQQSPTCIRHHSFGNKSDSHVQFHSDCGWRDAFIRR